MNVQMRVRIFRTFMIHLFVHMHQKKKIALEIATKNESVSRPLIDSDMLNQPVCLENLFARNVSF
jgi:hypothetical protein